MSFLRIGLVVSMEEIKGNILRDEAASLLPKLRSKRRMDDGLAGESEFVKPHDSLAKFREVNKVRFQELLHRKERVALVL